MQLLAPLMALLALAVIPPVVALYFLKLKRQEVVVSSTWLWRRAVEDLRVNAPFQKLKKSLLLLLQLLLLVLLVLALVRPVLRWQGVEGQSLILLIDTSASMAARDVAPDRLGAAKAEALKAVDGLARGDRVMVVAFSDKARVACPLTADKAEIRRAIGSLAVQETRTNLAEALRIALSIAERQAQAAVTILSDGGFEPVADLPPHRASLHYVSLGDPEAVRNAGLAGLEARRPYDASPDYQVFASVINTGTAREEFRLELHHNDVLLDVQPVALDPGKEHAYIYDRPGLTEGVVRVEIDAKDHLDADNRAWAVLSPDRDPRILFVTKGNYFLEHALELAAGESLAKTDPASFAAAVAGGTVKWADYDLVAADDLVLPSLPREAPALLWFNGAPPIEGFSAKARVKQPSILDWKRTHPVMRFVSLANVNVAEAATIAAPPWAETLVESDQGPILVAAETAARRVVIAGFSVFDTDWPLRISYPLFLSNAVAWLTTGSAGGAGAPAAIATGEVLAVTAGPEAKTVTVTPPEGEPSTLAVGAGRRAVYAQTGRAGLYRVKEDTGASSVVAANLLHRMESDLAPRKAIELGGEAREGVSNTIASNREVWTWAAALGLIVLCVEWYVYTRGLAR
jgi:hypothetical protein